MILKKFLKFPKSEPHDSYKLDSYKKVYISITIPVDVTNPVVYYKSG